MGDGSPLYCGPVSIQQGTAVRVLDLPELVELVALVDAVVQGGTLDPLESAGLWSAGDPDSAVASVRWWTDDQVRLLLGDDLYEWTR